jgi:HEAT repeat protein
MKPTVAMFSLDLTDSSTLLLAAFVGTVLLAGLLFQVGLAGWALRALGNLIQFVVRTGFGVWRRLLAWAPWPVFLALVLGLLALGVLGEEDHPGLAVLIGLVLHLLGLAACLAYVSIDLERYEVSRGYKVLHNPLKGQELAVNLIRYGPRVGIPLLLTAAIASVTGFGLLNQGLYDTVGRDWYVVGQKPPAHIQDPLDAYREIFNQFFSLGEEPAQKAAPTYVDFLAYTLINLFRVVDLLDIANTYNYAHLTFVRQARWPASTLLILFKTFFTFILLEQIFSSLRQYKALGDTVNDFWSPHPPVHERAKAVLPQHGAAAVRPLLRSLHAAEVLTVEQRAEVPDILADIGPAGVPLLVRALQDPDENVRAVAAAALGRLQAFEALPMLVRAAHDPSEWVRLSLVEALGHVCGPDTRVTQKKWSIRLAVRGAGRWYKWVFLWRKWYWHFRLPHPVELAVATLRAALADPATPVRRQAALTLGQIGPAAAAAAPELVALLADADESVRCQAAESLGKLGDPAEATVAALAGLLQDASAAVRAAAARALGALKQGAAAAVPELGRLVQDRDEGVRQAAAEAIAQVGAVDGAATPILVEGLSSRDNVVRAQTAEALGTIGESAADTTPALVRSLADANDRVRAKAAEALGKIGAAAAEAVPALTRALQDRDNRVSALAALALGEMGPASAEAVPALTRALGHINPEVRANAARALGKLGDAAAPAVPALEQAVRDEDGAVRGQAVLALGAVSPAGPAAGRAVRAALADADPAVRAAAVEALGLRGEPYPAAAADLVKALQDPSDAVKVQAARALSRLTGPPAAAVEGLCRLLDDDSDEVRAEAALALGKLGPAAAAAGGPLLRVLQTAGAAVREPAMRAMALIQPPEGEAAFLLGLKDAEAEVRKVASAGLLKAPQLTAQVLPYLVEALRDPEAQVRSNAAHVMTRLEALPPEAIPLLIECTADPDDGLRLNAVKALKAASPDAVGSALQALMEDPNPRIRLIAAGYVLGDDPAHRKAAAVLTEALAHPTVVLRKTAVALVDTLGPHAVLFVEVVKERVEAEAEPELKERLARVLERLSQRAAEESPADEKPATVSG